MEEALAQTNSCTSSQLLQNSHHREISVAAALSNDVEEEPPRPSSDEDVIRAAAEVVARDNGTLPIFPQSCIAIDNDDEFFAVDASSNVVTVASELTNDEVVHLTGLGNLNSLNNLVTFVSDLETIEEVITTVATNTEISGEVPVLLPSFKSPTSSHTETDHSEDRNGGEILQKHSNVRPGVEGSVKHHAESQGSFLKEGSRDPVLTATAQINLPNPVAVQPRVERHSEPAAPEASDNNINQLVLLPSIEVQYNESHFKLVTYAVTSLHQHDVLNEIAVMTRASNIVTPNHFEELTYLSYTTLLSYSNQVSEQ